MTYRKMHSAIGSPASGSKALNLGMAAFPDECTVRPPRSLYEKQSLSEKPSRSEQLGHQMWFTVGHGSLQLDLCLESQPKRGGAVLVGQLADRQAPLRLLARLAVRVIGGGRDLAQAESNRNGEFLVEYPVGKGARLRVELASRRLLEVPLEHGGVQG